MLQIDLLSRLANSAWLAPLSTLCLQAAPPTKYREIYQSVACGAHLPATSFSSALKTTGALHMVVSQGLHLTLCLEGLSTMSSFAGSAIPRSLRRTATPDRYARAKALLSIGSASAFVAAFAAILGFQAPIARAALGLGLRKLSQAHRLNWSFAQRTIASGLLCLALERSFWASHSLQLALAGCLGLGFARRPLRRCLWAYATTAPLLLPLQGAHPLAGAVSWAMTPIFSFALYPATLLAFAFSPAAWLSDGLWHWTEGILHEAHLALFSGGHWIERTAPIPEPVRWAYVAAVAAVALTREARARRSIP